jgi:hypothetical protein
MFLRVIRIETGGRLVDLYAVLRYTHALESTDEGVLIGDCGLEL